eukprot:CAMPEP_0177406858 /NCGR_PEP_ID=MMETSP0368-20130122/62787_1 /TAXON_ID=447022 ORGANISM="Scrippsiella hangoei-like, Strain SHHI-4" /NCGR_SAMPLE_ID=MMETSP0368 /ASSEMBLY_ACC=CAM_ASM_000363 /LENGTH=35 /DNA_ID= /DNA_START= /DNA_END= /DNA_ORIENTATION=
MAFDDRAASGRQHVWRQARRLSTCNHADDDMGVSN